MKKYVTVDELRVNDVIVQTSAFDFPYYGTKLTDETIEKVQEACRERGIDKVLAYEESTVQAKIYGHLEGQDDEAQADYYNVLYETKLIYQSLLETITSLSYNIYRSNMMSLRLFNELVDTIVRIGIESPQMLELLYNIRVEDDYRHQNMLNTTFISVRIGLSLNYSQYELTNLAKAAILANTGFAKMNKNIVSDRYAYSAQEYEIMKQHPITSYEFASLVPGLINREGLNAILQHHERPDGKGYPYNKQESQINDYAKIIAIAEAYDSMTSARAYKPVHTPLEAVLILLNNVGTQFCSYKTSMFVHTLQSMPIGSIIMLDNKYYGTVAGFTRGGNDKQYPIVIVFADKANAGLEPFTLIVKNDEEFRRLQVSRIINTKGIYKFRYDKVHKLLMSKITEVYENTTPHLSYTFELKLHIYIQS